MRQSHSMRFSGKKLRELRQARKLDQTSLSHLARKFASGMTQAQVSRYENGQQPSGHNAIALAAALEVDVRELYEPDDDEEAAQVADLAISRGDLLDALKPLASLYEKAVNA